MAAIPPATTSTAVLRPSAPVGVDQTVELDPTQQPVLIQGVPVP